MDNIQCLEGGFINCKLECEYAAQLLGLSDTIASIEPASLYGKVPRGCFWAWGNLYFNPEPGNGKATAGREPICRYRTGLILITCIMFPIQ